LDHGVVDTLGSISVIMPATFYDELEAHFGMPRSTEISAQRCKLKTRIIQTERGAATSSHHPSNLSET
jgi:hypothetical protein